ncbi:DUF4870 domain-containing protein [Microbacterium sp. ISL-103]|uniref:DUF4870 domain-containing protein n=1 Tax=Microbacterium sp. ISL-103 TaxID=2819156 RepID=UPI001BEA05D6|nr:DUF4870 domain-containing protein [Microbacterium sp. ISL-103]MBT2476294.1 DUF4870 domain-containing protein [Microbacterium sp. ISL-103]
MSDAERETGPSAAPAYPSVPPAPPAPPAQGPVPPAPVYGYAPPQSPGYAQQPAPQHQTPGYAPPAAPGQFPSSPQPVGYAPPAQGYPAQRHPAQGYPAQGYPAGAYPAAVPPRGLLPWALGLLILIPFPFVGGLASGIAMAVSGGASRRFGGVARENARAALNWGLTYLLVSTILLVSHFVILATLTADSPSSGFYPIGIPITIYFALSVFHVVLVIVGMVKASSGKVVRVPFAIPYLRA